MLYHYLISGLPNIERDDNKPVPDLDWLRAELDEQLTDADKGLIDLVSMDIDAMPLTEEQQEHIETLREPDRTNYKQKLYYDKGLGCGNDFVRQWFAYLMTVNNIVTALLCRRHGWDVRNQVVGDDEVARLLRSSNARDFDLPPIVEDYSMIAAVAEEENLFLREKKLDALKWQWLEEHSFDKFFGIEQVVAYWLQVSLLTRWKALTIEQGTQVFRNLLDELKKTDIPQT